MNRQDNQGTSKQISVNVRDVSKSYKLYDGTSSRLKEAFDLKRRAYHKEIYALHDISFEIERGTTLGILGVNGSGKSTLLQVICGILEPSSGKVTANGRIAALIELGAGFSPHLTGRENVSINSAIMGLSSREINARMDEIEEFAEVGEFFEQPVRTYSSGMLMRVAFAMSIHVDPDILVIDEALSVGDARFQQKCFARFRSFQDAGKTILFVTHDRFSLPRFCTRGLVLHAGKMAYIGKTTDAVECYNEILINGAPSSFPEPGPVSDQEQMADEGETQKTDNTPARILDTATPPAPEKLDEEELAMKLDTFAGDSSTTDRCLKNPCYNKNEKSIGIGGARIIDFMTIVDGVINPAHVASGGTIRLAVCVHFSVDCESPIVGMTLKAKDGTVFFATNSLWLNVTTKARKAGDIATYCFEFPLHLGANDWFIDLAVASSQTVMFNERSSLVHLRCDPDYVCHGLAALQTKITELDVLL